LIARLLGHGVTIAFFAGLHLGVDTLIDWTGQAHKWWAPVVTNFAAACFLISFIVIGGSELAADCWEAVDAAVRRMRKR